MSWFAGYELFFYLTEDITFFFKLSSLYIAHILQTALLVCGFGLSFLLQDPSYLRESVLVCSQGGRSETLKEALGMWVRLRGFELHSRVTWVVHLLRNLWFRTFKSFILGWSCSPEQFSDLFFGIWGFWEPCGIKGWGSGQYSAFNRQSLHTCYWDWEHHSEADSSKKSLFTCFSLFQLTYPSSRGPWCW